MTQEQALDILKQGHNAFLTGSAGTGKTYLINQYVSYLKAREVPVAVTASTGIAATHIGGQTIHSWSGIGIKNEITKANLILLEKNDKLVKRLKETQVLIIDEVSMLSGQILTGVHQILKHFRKNEHPFGGVQVLLSGDFFQLPPVFRTPVPSKEKFAFMSPIWVEANFKICYLTKQYRQDESPLNAILTALRERTNLPQIANDLRSRGNLEAQSNAVKLYTHNVDVDEINDRKLEELSGDTNTFPAKTKGNKKLIESLKASVLAQPELNLKVSAKVMFVRNNPERGYHNGTLGTVMEFDDDGYPLIKTVDGKWIVAKPEEWTVTDDSDKILVSYKQLPLRLAWAITIHKSQGMTLDQAEIDLSKTFEAGQGYVALSRLKSIEGLFLKGFNEKALQIDNLAFKADKRFQELSEEHATALEAMEKEEVVIAQLDFIEQCGGTNDPDIIEKNQNRQKEKPVYTKENTYDRTRKMIEAGKSLEEIAFERDLTQGTIISHLQYLKKEEPEFAIDQFKPETRTIEKVAKVTEQLQKEGNEEFFDSSGAVKLGYIHRALNGKLDYEEIRLARLFL